MAKKSLDDLLAHIPDQSPPSGSLDDIMDAYERRSQRPPPRPLAYPGEGIVRGFKSGVEDITHGLLQPVLENLLGERIREGSKRVAEQRAQEKRFIGQEAPIQSFVGTVAGKGAVAAPAVLAAPTSQMGLLSRILINAGIGFGTGFSEYGTPTERLQAGLTDAAAGALFPELIGTTGRVIKGGKDYLQSALELAGKRLGYFPEKIAEDVIKPKGFKPEYLQSALEKGQRRTGAAEELGIQLTPGEALGSPSIAQKEASLGVTPKGNALLEEFYRQPETGRYAQENRAVDDFFKDLGVNPNEVDANTSRKIRNLANELIEEQKNIRSAQASPLYEASREVSVPKEVQESLFQDDNIVKALQDLNQEPAYRQALKKMDEDSLGKFDLIKRNLGDKIAMAKRKGANAKAMFIKESQDKLVNALDEISPDYKAARRIFADESSVVNDLMKSNLGKIASLEDKQLKNLSNILFDPAQIDPKTRGIVTDRLLQSNPKLYYDAMAEKMFKKIDTLNADATKRKAPSFYRALLAKDKDYNYWRDALQYNPDALKRLDNMKEVFDVLGGDFTPKAAARLEKTGMLNPRDFVKGVIKWIAEGGKYDEAAIKFITDPVWMKQADQVLNLSNNARPAATMNLLNKIVRNMGKVDTRYLSKIPRELSERTDEE